MVAAVQYLLPTSPVQSQPIALVDSSGNVISASNPLQISGSFTATVASNGPTGAAVPASADYLGASDGTNLQGLLVESASQKNLRVGIYQAGSEASVGAFHNSDGQAFSAITNVLATGGSVPYLYNPGGLADRQRAIGADGIPAMGIAAGGQNLAGPALTTTFGGSVTGNASAQSVLVASSSSVMVGDIVLTQDNAENVEITAKADGTHVTGIFKNNHANGQTLTWYHYNQARDATIGDQVAGTGVSPSATYLYNNIAANFELDRSANGEKDGASGQGTAVAAEYEWNGNMPANGGTLSGLAFDRARNLVAKGLGSGTLANNPLAANATTLTLNANPTTLDKGQLILLDRAGANPEWNVVGTGYTFGSVTVPLQIATINAHNQNTTVEWDQNTALGPGLSGFLASGLGIEEEAIYNSVDGKMYIQRSATADALAGANIPADGLVLYNGATFDRLKGDNTGSARVSLYGQQVSAGDTAVAVTASGQVKVVAQSNGATIIGQVKLVDTAGTNVGAIKAASTAAVATDTSLVVALSPNSPIPAGSAVIGALTANQSINTAQVAGTTTSVNNGTTDAGTQRVTLSSDSTGQVKLATGANTIGALTANQSTNTVQLNGNTVSVDAGTSGNGTQRVIQAGAATNTKSNVASSASSVTILASNTSRKGASVYNDSTQILYLDESGGTASSSSYTVQIPANGFFELPGPTVYNGAITGIWAAANGNARVKETT